MSEKLRFELNCLWPSEIADQLYCEYKVHLKRTHPEVLLDLPALDAGEAGHTALTAELPAISPEAIDRAIEEGKRLAVCEWTMEGLCLGVKLRGRPDLFSFEGKEARLMLDFKFSKATRVFPGQKLQASLYALMAGSMGFDTAHLWYGVVLFPRTPAASKSERLQAFARDGTLRQVSEQCEAERRRRGDKGRTATVRGQGWQAEMWRFDRAAVERELAPLLTYWLGERGAVPQTSSERKCIACPLNAVGLCEHALAPADEAFTVQAGAAGTVYVTRSY